MNYILSYTRWNQLHESVNRLNEKSVNIGGAFKTDLDNGPSNHSKRALGNWQSDNAWDIFSPPGTVVNSYTDGVVAKVRDTGSNSGKIFGTQVSIKGTGNYPDIFYTHLKNVSLKPGDKVKVGDYLGEISDWQGHSGSEHVHIGLPKGRHLRELLANSSKIFTGTRGKSEESTPLPAQQPQAQALKDVELSTHQERLVKRFIKKMERDDSIIDLIDSKEELVNVAPEELTKLAKNLNIDEVIVQLWILNQIEDSEFIETIAKNLVAAGLSRRDRKQAISTAEPVAQLAGIASGQKILKLGSTGEDVKVIRQKLYDLGFMEEMPSDKFDQATDNAVREFQTEKQIRIDGIVGPETYGTLFGVAFDPNAERTKIEIVDGKIKSSYTGEKQNNINILINEMVKQGITNPYAQIGVLSVVGKETNYIPKSEIMNYSKERLPEVWGVFSKTGNRVPKGQGQFNYNDLAVEYANNPEKLANFVYGQKPYGMRDNAYGNTQPGDGWKYRGRGFNQVTFKSSYEKLGREVGMDLVNNPDALNSVNVAAEVAIKFLLNRFREKGIDPNQFTSINQAVETFARANAGWGSNASTAIASAMEKSKAFSVA